MIFIGVLKGLACAVVILLCFILLLKLSIKNFRFDDEVSFLLMVSIVASAILMSIFFCVKGAESKVLYAHSKVNSALSQTQGESIQESVMRYIDENFPEITSVKNNAAQSKSEVKRSVDKYTNSAVKQLRITRYIILLIEVIVHLLLFVFIRNKYKGRQGGSSGKIDYMNSGYYE
ncbi:MAG: hypothetical protein SNJ29_10850 [Rikenellaceae bacterium]